jgi:hypothetical protein
MPLEDGKTLRSLQAEIRGYETPVIAPIRGTQFEKIDLKHGQAVFFLVGRIVSSHFFGNFVGTATYDLNRLKSYDYNIASSKPKFEVWAFDNVYRYALTEPPPMPVGWKLIILVSAEDRKSQQIVLTVRPGDEKAPLTYANGEARGEEK